MLSFEKGLILIHIYVSYDLENFYFEALPSSATRKAEGCTIL
jgi:hypothetical protein